MYEPNEGRISKFLGLFYVNFIAINPYGSRLFRLISFRGVLHVYHDTTFRNIDNCAYALFRGPCRDRYGGFDADNEKNI